MSYNWSFWVSLSAVAISVGYLVFHIFSIERFIWKSKRRQESREQKEKRRRAELTESGFVIKPMDE